MTDNQNPPLDEWAKHPDDTEAAEAYFFTASALSLTFVVDSYGKVRQVSPRQAEEILSDGGREPTDPEIRAWYTGRKQTPPS